jgi:hypothetical protein
MQVDCRCLLDAPKWEAQAQINRERNPLPNLRWRNVLSVSALIWICTLVLFNIACLQMILGISIRGVAVMRAGSRKSGVYGFDQTQNGSESPFLRDKLPVAHR